MVAVVTVCCLKGRTPLSLSEVSEGPCLPMSFSYLSKDKDGLFRLLV